METEIEVKILGLPEKDLVDQLRKKGAVFSVEEKQTNIRYDSTSHPIPVDGHLRIRRIQVEGQAEEIEFTYKKRQANRSARVNIERTVHIDAVEELEAILVELGFDQKKVGTKIRRRYLYGDYRVEFDTWDLESFPFPYIEVEAPSTEALEAFLREFSIPKRRVSTLSIRELKAAWDQQETWLRDLFL